MANFSPEDLVVQTHNHLNRYIGNADNKASILLTAQLAFLGLVANVIGDIPSDKTGVTCFVVASAGVTVVRAFLSGFVVYPRPLSRRIPMTTVWFSGKI